MHIYVYACVIYVCMYAYIFICIYEKQTFVVAESHKPGGRGEKVGEEVVCHCSINDKQHMHFTGEEPKT